MRVEFRIFTDPEKPIKGKIIIRPETPEEQQGMDEFKTEMGLPVGERRLEIIYSPTRVAKNKERLTVDQAAVYRGIGS